MPNSAFQHLGSSSFRGGPFLWLRAANLEAGWGEGGFSYTRAMLQAQLAALAAEAARVVRVIDADTYIMLLGATT